MAIYQPYIDISSLKSLTFKYDYKTGVGVLKTIMNAPHGTINILAKFNSKLLAFNRWTKSHHLARQKQGLLL